ncbi:hypothetical protein [Phascolarctobacterium sp.]
MKQLFNYCSLPMYEAAFPEVEQNLQSVIREFGLAGIEQRVYQPAGQVPYSDLTVGVHLNYWPEWMNFFWGNQKALSQSFADAQQLKDYYGGAANVGEWLDVIKNNLQAALSVQPEYLVWHVSNASDKEVFTFDFQYTDEQVLEATAALFNSVCHVIPDNVSVLFENLWWPGLRLLEPELVENFFSSLKTKHVGIMLDTGHLMNTNKYLTDECAGIAYIQRTIDKLGDLKDLIRGVHLSCSLSGEYQQTFAKVMPPQTDFAALLTHIAKIDQHRPFSDAGAAEILEKVQPQYLVHELFYDNFADMGVKLAQQQLACGFRSR